MDIRKAVYMMKEKAQQMASSDPELRNGALRAVKKCLLQNKAKIFEANEEDLRAAAENQVPVQVQKRLTFDEKKLQDVTAGIDQLILLPDPVGKIQMKRELDADLVLTRITVPIGVIGVIFEARPDALVQISCLCIKSGNCAVLKGGKETAATNRVLFDLIHNAVIAAGLPAECLYQAENHTQIEELLSCDDCVDLLIPRGSNKFVRYIMDHTKIPVMGHADGVCHIYVDADADFDTALRVIADAKTQYPVACNAVETVLVDRKIAEKFLPLFNKEMKDCGVRIYGTEETAAVTGCERMAEPEDFHKEYGDLEITCALVDGVKGAAAHINRYGSHHTDAIITENDETAAFFFHMVDSAGVYRNCSTRFADGYRYGFGAEVGISTSKLHARGPVGLEGLVTYKYLLEGNGQTVGDYASGRKQFRHRDLPFRSK